MKFVLVKDSRVWICCACAAMYLAKRKLSFELIIRYEIFFQIFDAGLTFSLMQVEADDTTVTSWRVVVNQETGVSADDSQQYVQYVCLQQQHTYHTSPSSQNLSCGSCMDLQTGICSCTASRTSWSAWTYGQSIWSESGWWSWTTHGRSSHGWEMEICSNL